jgi:ABC-type amino acid transport system permease subunit
MANDALGHLLVPIVVAVAGCVYGLLRSGIPRLGTVLGKAVGKTRSRGYVWAKRYLPIAAATYVLLIGLLISFGTLTPEALIIGCPAVAIAAAYLVNYFRPERQG